MRRSRRGHLDDPPSIEFIEAVLILRQRRPLPELLRRHPSSPDRRHDLLPESVLGPLDTLVSALNPLFTALDTLSTSLNVHSPSPRLPDRPRQAQLAQERLPLPASVAFRQPQPGP